jgi:hypothetical protein
MAKLRDLIATTAHLLGDSEASINVLAIQLRRADLIRKEGRGLNAADMSAADAAALLTSAMAGGLATETAETTARVLNCDNVVRPSGIEHPAGAKLSRPSRELHPWIQTFDRPHTFGEAFTGLFEYCIAGESPEPKHEIAGAIISVERTAAFYECKIFLSTGVGSVRL